MIPSSASLSLKVVATDTESNTASTATPAITFCSCERDAELVEGRLDLRIEIVEALQRRLLLRGRVVDDVLEVDRREVHVVPLRFGHPLPDAECVQAPRQQPLRLALLGRDDPDDLLVQPRRDRLGVDVGDEAVLVVLIRKLLDAVGRGRHDCLLPVDATPPAALGPSEYRGRCSIRIPDQNGRICNSTESAGMHANRRAGAGAGTRASSASCVLATQEPLCFGCAATFLKPMAMTD